MKQLVGGEMTCRSSDLDDLLVASSLVARLPDGETTRHHVGEFLSPKFHPVNSQMRVTYIFWLRTPWLPCWKSLTIIPICRVVSTNCSIVCPNNSNLSGTLSSTILEFTFIWDQIALWEGSVSNFLFWMGEEGWKKFCNKIKATINFGYFRIFTLCCIHRSLGWRTNSHEKTTSL